ncbi:GntR family transcriptional regulator domain / Aspartate aminotransferase [Salmonella enterica subsp. indica serovar 6,14,25:z10:1,(2),7 str. 1121]|uniref:GntR family transcriptional regulator domain / Aspartate aminotransferase n=1 Tax=Salmonella enterica subsp. indica serovar 6,14,25:z10:1,(2),7 str. 1121 TaxID=1173950 RepID=V1H1Z3_SALER|nr:GntR family transcriptional regulator domain / Aspartate aminotransferase [Salmonella enterica subsp. indica serovar 6,14,25:z10:1,(2),7 str. 1121]
MLWQRTLADFIRDDHFWRHLKKMRRHYAQRRLWIEEALAEQGLVVTLQKGGLQLVIEVEDNNKAQVAKANQAGLAVQ